VKWVFGPGDCFGDLSMFLQEERTADVDALTYCDVFVLRKQVFDHLRSTHPELKDVMKRLATQENIRRSEMLLDGIFV